MAGRDDDTEVGFEFYHAEADHGRGDEACSDMTFDAVGAQYSGSCFYKKWPGEAAIVADDGLFHFAGFHKKGRCFGYAFYVVDRVIIGDDRAPAVGTKLDGCCHDVAFDKI